VSPYLHAAVCTVLTLEFSVKPMDSFMVHYFLSPIAAVEGVCEYVLYMYVCVCVCV